MKSSEKHFLPNFNTEYPERQPVGIYDTKKRKILVIIGGFNPPLSAKIPFKYFPLIFITSQNA